jgi:hypothetical protein
VLASWVLSCGGSQLLSFHAHGDRDSVVRPWGLKAGSPSLAKVDVRTLADGLVAALIDVQDPFGEPPGPTRFS